MTAATIPVNQRFLVQTVNVPGEVGKRLADMGFTSGAEGIVIRRGFFHGPLQVMIRGYSVLIRDDEAKLVLVSPSPAATH